MRIMHERIRVHERTAEDHRADARWYVVHTHARAEDTAACNLERQGFNVFLPLRSRNVSHARQVKTVKEAYFPRYLFVWLNLERDQWFCVKSTRGVKHMLCASDRPLPVREGLVEALTCVVQPDGVLKPSRLLEPGQKVRILDGPFAEQIGRLERVSGADAVLVLLHMMDREVGVRLSSQMIHVIS